MIEIKHSQKLIDIHPLIIYFILSDQECDEYARRIKSLNRYVWTSLGLFEYRCVRRLEREYGDLPTDLSQALNENNVMVKLMSDGGRYDCYAFHYVDLAGEEEEVIEALRMFAREVCRRDIEQLESYVAKLKRQSIEANGEQIGQYTAIKEHFAKALKKRPRVQPAWAESEEGSVSVSTGSRTIKVNAACEISTDIDTILRKHGMSKDEAEMTSREIRRLIDDIYRLDKKSSHKNAQYQVYGSKSSGAQSRISIERFTSVTKHGKAKWGVNIMVEGTAYPIVFASKDQTMLYFAMLLRHKMGRKLYLNELCGNSTGAGGKADMIRWLKSLYDIVFRWDSRDFKDWSKMFLGSSHAVSQAKSRCNKILVQEVAVVAKEYMIQLEKEHNRKSYYTIDCSSANIDLPSELKSLMAEDYML